MLDNIFCYNNKHYYRSIQNFKIIQNLKIIKKFKNILYFSMQTIQNFLYFIYINLFYLSNNAAVFLFVIINYLYLKKNGNLSKRNIEYLCYFCNNSGVIYIKFFQWLLSKADFLNISDTDLQLIKNTFIDVFENCKLHSYKYTEKVLENEFYSVIKNNTYISNKLSKIFNTNNFDCNRISINTNPIASGSIAQIYECIYLNNYGVNNNVLDNNNIKFCIKIVHPNIYYQCLYTKIYMYILFNLLKIFVKNINLFDMPFEYNNLYNNFIKQCNMENEYVNLLSFYNNYNNNEYIIIPKPIFASKNLLIMSREDGEKLEDIHETDYVKNKILILLNLFIHDSIFSYKLSHCDLHQGNWKVQKYNNFYKIIIYDFGYCIKTDNNEIIKTFLHNWLSKNFDIIIDNVIKYLFEDNNKYDEIYSHAKQYNDFIKNFDCLLLLKYLLETSKKFNIGIKDDIFNVLLTFTLIENYLKKYYVLKTDNRVIKEFDRDEEFDKLKQYCLNYIVICNEYNIFPNMSDFYSNIITSNQNKYNNTFGYNFLKSGISQNDKNTDMGENIFEI
jgi:predicted unusual protein kinase regulating ubiquinone biosynthesis (AarF/ABC1/UbiB family)